MVRRAKRLGYSGIVWNWLRRRRSSQRVEAQSDLKGAPINVRTKTYSAATGYVYQYVYRGYRSLTLPESGTEFVFSVFAAPLRNPRSTVDVLVRLTDSSLAAGAGRELTNSERYAVAKMTLFAAFDEVTEMERFQKPFVPDAAAVREQLRMLDRL